MVNLQIEWKNLSCFVGLSLRSMLFFINIVLEWIKDKSHHKVLFLNLHKYNNLVFNDLFLNNVHNVLYTFNTLQASLFLKFSTWYFCENSLIIATVAFLFFHLLSYIKNRCKCHTGQPKFPVVCTE